MAEQAVPITLFLASQDGQGVTGRLYNVPEWNWDHGYGKYADWHDYSFPADIEEGYRKIEQAAPAYSPPECRPSPPKPHA